MTPKPGQHHRNLGSDLVATVRDLIEQGELAPESRINEVRIAEQLGVSRTPLREALSRLASAGLVRSEPRRGFFVPALDAREYRELCELRGLLARAALHLAGTPDLAILYQLDASREEIAQGASPHRQIGTDRWWQETLLAACPNQQLLLQLDAVTRKLQRYEALFLSEIEETPQPRAGFRVVSERLRNDELHEAADELAALLGAGLPGLPEWIARRAKEQQ